MTCHRTADLALDEDCLSVSEREREFRVAMYSLRSPQISMGQKIGIFYRHPSSTRSLRSKPQPGHLEVAEDHRWRSYFSSQLLLWVLSKIKVKHSPLT